MTFSYMYIVLVPQKGMSMFLVWAYHSSDVAQPLSFSQHMDNRRARGVKGQILIPAITPSPTPGKNAKSYGVKYFSLSYRNNRTGK